MASSVELRQRLAEVRRRQTDITDAAEAEDRDLTAEEDQNYRAADTELEGLARRIERAEREERSPASESRGAGPVERPTGTETRSAEEISQERRDAFVAWARGGFLSLDAEQRQVMSRQAVVGEEARAMGIAPNATAGYLVPDETRRSIEQAMSAFGGMREAAQVFQTSNGADLYIPTVNDTSNTGELVGEHQAVTEQDASVGQRLYRAYMYSSKEVKVSLQLLQDSAFDIESLLRDLFAERLGRITNTHFTNGSGADRPTGIMQDSVLGVTAAATTSVTADELINLEYTIDRAYRGQARWMFHSNTLRDLRKLKDGDGRYIWQPGMTTGNPNTLFGYAYVVNDDMPAMTSALKPIAFGQLSKYLIRDVMGIRVIRLDERHAEQGQVAFFAFSRHDGRLLDAGTNPVKHILMA